MNKTINIFITMVVLSFCSVSAAGGDYMDYLTKGQADTFYITTGGFSMEGDIDMGGYSIYNAHYVNNTITNSSSVVTDTLTVDNYQFTNGFIITTSGDMKLLPFTGIIDLTTVDIQNADWVESGYFTSTVPTGTAPYQTSSTTVNTNLNADLLDSFHLGTSGSTIPLLSTGNIWTGTQTFDTSTKLQFRDTSMFINSPSSGVLDIQGATEIEFAVGVGPQFVLKDGLIEPTNDNDIALGTSSKRFANVSATEFIGDGSKLTGISGWTNGTDIFVSKLNVTDTLTVGTGDNRLIVRNDATNTYVNSSNNDLFIDMGDDSTINGQTTYFYKGDVSGEPPQTPQSADPLGVIHKTDSARIRGMYVYAEGTKNGFPPPANTVQGLNAFAATSGSAHWQSITGGIYGATVNSADSGVVSNVYGIQTQVALQPTGATTVLNAHHISTGMTPINDADLTLTTIYGIDINPISTSAGTVTNAYGLNIDAITAGATNNFALKTSSGNVSLGDNTQIKADLDVTGNFTGNQIYGEMWNHTDAGVTITVSAVDQYTNVTGLVQGELNGIHMTDDMTLNPKIPGKYKIAYSLSFSGTANNEISIDILVNEVATERCHSHRTLGTTGIGNAGGTCFWDLSIDDNVRLAVRDETVPAQDITMVSADVNMIRIGT